MAADAKIFENITIPNYELHHLDWFIPSKNQTLQSYAQQLATDILHDRCSIIGVSFGGILAQEIAKFRDFDHIILISSVKSCHEFPFRFRISKWLRLHRLLPTSFISSVNDWNSILSLPNLKPVAKLYNLFFVIKDKQYLDWSIDQIINWNQDASSMINCLHIHGDNDAVFPISNISNVVAVQGGTHAMIVFKYRIINRILNDYLNSK